MNNTYLAYTRVSTAKQGEGVSLEAQRDGILRYAERQRLAISRWFEEKETAAKRGRPVFGEMLKLLEKGQARGVIIHKIDRSARNLKDWANLGELIDAGVEVHFANESLDLNSRGGRLSADIQAVVAADYIRNLREETRKGFYGRLKQGLYPLRAPLGYLDNGGGRPKTIDPVSGPLVRQAFEIYARGELGLNALVPEMERRGLWNHYGNPVSRNGLSTILRNPFYIGIIRLREGESFAGIHEPLVSKRLFDRVQGVMDGKTIKGLGRYAYLFRRLFRCSFCGYSLIAERQKGHVYYRCHTKDCPTTGVREEVLEQSVLEKLSLLKFTPQETRYLLSRVEAMRTQWREDASQERQSLALRIDALKDRLGRLTDAYLDQSIEKNLFEERKASLLTTRFELEERLAGLEEQKQQIPARLQEFLELAQSACSCYKSGQDDERRELVGIVTSNRLVSRKEVQITLKEPFRLIAERASSSDGRLTRARHRILDALLAELGTILAQEEYQKLLEREREEEYSILD